MLKQQQILTVWEFQVHSYKCWLYAQGQSRPQVHSGDVSSLLGYADMQITVTLPLPLDPSSQGQNSDRKFTLKISETEKN